VCSRDGCANSRLDGCFLIYSFHFQKETIETDQRKEETRAGLV
jgi:hypothetical protein